MVSKIYKKKRAHKITNVKTPSCRSPEAFHNGTRSTGGKRIFLCSLSILALVSNDIFCYTSKLSAALSHRQRQDDVVQEGCSGVLNEISAKEALCAHTARHCAEDALHRPCDPLGKPFGDQFTLENFISNKKNFFPLALACDIIKPQQEPSYTPLIYYGKSGSGKTHLLRAIANALSNTYDHRTIFFGNILELLQNCKQQASSSGINKYQAYCVDDIQLFAKILPWQEIFLSLSATCLYEKKKFVCACSDVFYKGLSTSLRSRMKRWRSAQLKNSDIDVRMRFTRSQCVLHDFNISQEHILLLAQRCEDLRYLADVLLKLAAYAKSTQREITKQDIEKIIRNADEHSPVAPKDIIHRVAEHFSMSSEEITGKKRKPALVFARQTAMYLCREILGTSYPVLGQIFGGKDHSTAIYSIKKIEKYILAHKNAHTEITTLKNMCFPTNN